MDAVGALRQGDDLGFRTATFLSPDVLRRLVLPIYTQLAAAAHAHGKPFILHSCGNLGSVYDDLIDTCRIDAKHSFEDSILPVEDFQARYGQRVTPLGGLDVDAICRLDEPALRAYVEHKIERCTSQGYWALGTGNSLTDYMPVDRYLLVLETGSGYFS
jgi:uroporphyrinogen decarboxylase